MSGSRRIPKRELGQAGSLEARFDQDHARAVGLGERCGEPDSQRGLPLATPGTEDRHHQRPAGAPLLEPMAKDAQRREPAVGCRRKP